LTTYHEGAEPRKGHRAAANIVAEEKLKVTDGMDRVQGKCEMMNNDECGMMNP
jgi:hypothetical protein